MTCDDLFAANSIIWPLTVLLIALFMLRKAEDSLRPVFTQIIGGVAKNAGSNANFYAIALMFGLSSSLSAFVEVFKEMDAAEWQAITWHQYAALWARILNPFFVTILAYTRDSGKDRKPTGTTEPPFPQPPSQ